MKTESYHHFCQQNASGSMLYLRRTYTLTAYTVCYKDRRDYDTTWNFIGNFRVSQDCIKQNMFVCVADICMFVCMYVFVNMHRGHQISIKSVVKLM